MRREPAFASHILSTDFCTRVQGHNLDLSTGKSRGQKLTNHVLSDSTFLSRFAMEVSCTFEDIYDITAIEN